MSDIPGSTRSTRHAQTVNEGSDRPGFAPMGDHVVEKLLDFVHGPLIKRLEPFIRANVAGFDGVAAQDEHTHARYALFVEYTALFEASVAEFLASHGLDMDSFQALGRDLEKDEDKRDVVVLCLSTLEFSNFVEFMAAESERRCVAKGDAADMGL